MALTDARFGLLRIALRDRIVVMPVTSIRHTARRRRMTPSRRQFVASVATVPFLTYPAAAQRFVATGQPDAVLDQILGDLRELSREAETQPGARKSTMRAMESTLAIGAAHLATHYDADFRSALRRRQDRQGRDLLVQDIVDRAYRAGGQNFAHATVDAAMTRLEQRGLSGCFRDIEQTIRKIRLQAPEQIQAASGLVRQFDYCADLNWMINLMEAVVQIACAISILEPTVGGEIACGALGLALGLLYLQRTLFC